MKLDVTKPLLTQQGYPVRILATDVCGWRTYRPHLANGDNTQARELRHDLIIGLVRKADGTDVTRRWTPEGFEINEDSIHNLVHPKVKKWRWAVNVLQNGQFSAWVTYLCTEEEVKTYADTHNFKVVGRILESEIEE